MSEKLFKVKVLVELYISAETESIAREAGKNWNGEWGIGCGDFDLDASKKNPVVIAVSRLRKKPETPRSRCKS